MSTEKFLELAVFVGSLWLVLRFGPPAVRAWRVYNGTGRRRQQDAVGRAPLASPAVADRANALALLGYHRLGETRLALPNGERFAWIVAANDGESYAILVDSPRRDALTGIYSAWLDGTWLSTIHPRGEAFARENLRVEVVPGALDEAVTVHRAGLETLKTTHGAPRPIRTMPDMLVLDADYRVRFGGSRLRPIVFRVIMPAIVATVLALLSFVLLFLDPQ